MDTMERIRENYEEVRARMTDAAKRTGRTPEEVMLVAVTKTVTADVARMLYDLGQRVFGENRVQEAQKKRNALAELKEASWHMIGTLQTNKAKKAVQLFDVIHSVDRGHLADALEQQAAKLHRRMPVLVEVNVSGEASKHGVAPEQALQLVESLLMQPHLEAWGLMTMAPIEPNPESCRPYFAKLRELLESIKTRLTPGESFRHLSMGMTQDYEVAIEEGATMVRVGTALFRGIDRNA